MNTILSFCLRRMPLSSRNGFECTLFMSAIAMFFLNLFTGCAEDALVQPQEPDSGNFAFEARYVKIRSYPGGGGIFPVRIIPGDDFSGNVLLTVSADPDMNARLNRNTLNRNSRMAELTIYPDQMAEINNYEILLTAMNSESVQSITLEVEMFDWTSDAVNDAIVKKDALINWLENEHPELGSFHDKDWFAYITYPALLVVSHWTFLNAEWEMRICYHVMIPPYDWSMLRLRKLGEWDPIYACKRESDGTTYEIPVSEYPTKFSY